VAWLESGGILVCFTADAIPPDVYGELPEVKGNLKTYRVNQGTVIVADASGYTNRALTKNTDDAYELFKQVEGYSPDEICFNEFYMFSDMERQTLWAYTPLEVKFVLFQLLLAFGAFLYWKGKRFGKPVPLYEEVERSENEYLHTVASLYRQAKCWDIVLANYYRSFLRELGYPHEEWLNYWKKEYRDSLKKARRVFEFMSKPLKGHSAKEYIQIVTILEHLKTVNQNGRERGWNTKQEAL